MYDDPDPVRHRIRKEDDRSDTGWAMGALLVLLLIGAVFMFTRSDRTNTASNSAADRPSATAPANPPSTSPPSTTGSGSSTRTRSELTCRKNPTAPGHVGRCGGEFRWARLPGRRQREPCNDRHHAESRLAVFGVSASMTKPLRIQRLPPTV